MPSSADAEFSERTSAFLVPYRGHTMACELFSVPGHDGKITNLASPTGLDIKYPPNRGQVLATSHNP